MTLKIKETSNNVVFFQERLEKLQYPLNNNLHNMWRKRFHVPRTTFDVCQILFCFCMGFFQHQMRGDDLNLLPIISPIFLYLQRNTDNSAFLLFRAASLRADRRRKNISMCKLHHSASVSMTLVPQYL